MQHGAFQMTDGRKAVARRLSAGPQPTTVRLFSQQLPRVQHEPNDNSICPLDRSLPADGQTERLLYSSAAAADDGPHSAGASNALLPLMGHSRQEYQILLSIMSPCRQERHTGCTDSSAEGTKAEPYTPGTTHR